MSKIEVDQITQQSGTTVTVGGGACKTAVVDATTVTLGRSGGTVQLASGASQSGFGRSGSVNWQTTPKTATFTAVNGEGYFINQGSAITANLPAGSAGAIVAFSDYARNFGTYNFTIAPNGSEKVGGIAQDLKLNVDGQAVTLVYVDSTKGWVNVQNSKDTQTGTSFTVATGGTITTSGDYKIHTFTGPGTFCVSAVGAPTNTADYLVIAGGGGGGFCMGGGGGAGGYRESPGSASGCYTVSPLGTSPATALTLAVQGYPITVGGGGGGGSSNHDRGCSGSVSTFSTISSAGGGGGGARPTSSPNNTLGLAGGSGGGNANDSPSGNVNPAGNTPPVTPPQGQPGGTGRGSNTSQNYSGGGGGATGAGNNGGPGDRSGCGGAGATSSINGTPTGRAGGGSGGIYSAGGHSKGTASDGGGVGGPGATNGTVNTGGGGGGAGHPADGGTQNGGTGGSGVVIIRYKFQ